MSTSAARLNLVLQSAAFSPSSVGVLLLVSRLRLRTDGSTPGSAHDVSYVSTHYFLLFHQGKRVSSDSSPVPGAYLTGSIFIF